jgi:hypothetical protein
MLVNMPSIINFGSKTESQPPSFLEPGCKKAFGRDKAGRLILIICEEDDSNSLVQIGASPNLKRAPYEHPDEVLSFDHGERWGYLSVDHVNGGDLEYSIRN